MSIFLAAIQSAPVAATPLPLHDIAEIDRMPRPLWETSLYVFGVALLLALLIWWIVRLVQRRPPPPPPSPRSVALKELAAIQAKMDLMLPHPFSVQVSDILRRYISAAYGLQAIRQTSHEFLEQSQYSPHFSTNDRELLSRFLEQCDLVKFARAEADAGVPQQLMTDAFAFVEGGLN